MKSLVYPPALKKGDTVAIVAMASKLDVSDLKSAIKLMENEWGVKVIIGESVSASYYGFAGTDDIRAADFQKALNNPDVKAIFSARGGYGSSRIIDKIDFTAFRQNPKWIVGFSDITVVHSHVQSLGFQSLHAPMPKTFKRDAFSVETLYAFLFGKSVNYQVKPNERNRMGRANGRITGGNLCLLAHVIGSVSDINWDGAILFIEDVGEYLYNIDRMLIQLKRAGKLKNLSGLVIGSFTYSKENDEPFGKSIHEIVAEHTAEYSYPVCYDFPVGHDAINWSMACGRMASLVVSNEEVKLEFENFIA